LLPVVCDDCRSAFKRRSRVNGTRFTIRIGLIWPYRVPIRMSYRLVHLPLRAWCSDGSRNRAVAVMVCQDGPPLLGGNAKPPRPRALGVLPFKRPVARSR
jgi:hypothetical protein